MAEIYGRTRRESTYFFEDAVTTLKALRPFYKLGLITNGPTELQGEEIDVLRVRDYLDYVIISEEVGSDKPDEVIFLYAAKLAECVVGEILYVGNSQFHDVLGAKRAGLKVAWINRRGETLKDGIPAPDFEVRTLGELLPYLIPTEVGAPLERAINSQSSE